MKAKTGFTLVETLVVITISMLIFGAVYGVNAVCRNSLQVGSTLLDIQRQASLGMDKMLRELYTTGSSTVTVEAQSASFGNKLLFQLPTIDAGTGTIYDANDDINWGDGTNTGYKIRYLVPHEGGANDGKLIERALDSTNTAVSDTILANGISSITFTGYDSGGSPDSTYPNSLTISITARKTTFEGRVLQTTLDSRVTFRN